MAWTMSIGAIVPGLQSGRYDVDEIRAEPVPSGHTGRSWG
jgi:hypothetical protein